MPTEAEKVRRIVMALDTASSVLPAIEAAAGLALGLNAELAGLFIEDERLLRFAGLPFAREFGFASARARPLAPAAVEHALRAQAEQLRRLLAATAERLSLAWTLEVVRGEVPRSVLATGRRLRPAGAGPLGIRRGRAHTAAPIRRSAFPRWLRTP